MARRLVIVLTVLVTVLISGVYVASDSVAVRTGLSQASILGVPAVVLLVVLRTPRAHRPPVLIILGASVSYVVAEALTASVTVDGAAPYPNHGEAFISVGAVLMLGALLLILGRRPRWGRAERLDVGIAAVGVVLLFAQTGVLTFAGSRTDGAALAVAGPLVLFAVTYLAIAVLLIGQPNGARPGTSMLVGAVAMVLADVGFLMSIVDGYDEDGRLSDVGYIVTRGAFVVLALQLGQRAPDGYRAVERYRVGVAGTVALLTPLGAVVGARTNPDSPEWLTVLALALPVVLLTWRAAITVGHMTDEAGVDPLTGLHSRRSVMETLERHCSDGPPFVLIICDLDGFKSVNDRYGHAAGDEVLRVFAHLLRQAAPVTATVARLGGDEFAVLVPRAEDPEAVREAVTGQLVAALAVVEGPARGVSASMGAAAGRTGCDAHDLFVLADGAMYSAKQVNRRHVPQARAPVPPVSHGPEAGALRT